MLPNREAPAPDQKIKKTIASVFERSFDHFVLTYLEPLVPADLQPNQITFFGFACGLFAALSLYLMGAQKLWIWGVAIALLLNTVADSLDGAVARARSLTSERGFLLDHLLDQLIFIALFLGVGFSNYALLPIAVMGAMVANLHLTIELFWILLRQQFPLPLIGPIEVRASALGLAVLTYVWGGSLFSLQGLSFGWFDVVNMVAVPFSFIEFCLSASKLYRELGTAQS